MVRDDRGHRLYRVVDIVESGLDDRLAEGLEPPHIEHDVVIDDEDRPCAVVTGIADVRNHPVKRVGVEIPAAHLDDRAEAAIERTAARGLDDIDLSPECGVSAEYPRVAVRQSYLATFQVADRSVRIVTEAVAVPVGQA